MSLLPPYTSKVWGIIGLASLGIAILGVVLFGIDRCGNHRFESGMKKANANLVNALDKLSNIQDQQAAKEKELQQIALEEAAQKQIVIQAAKDAEAAAKAENEARLAANQVAENLNAINAKDFNGSTLENAERARCRAFPESCK